MIKTNAKPPTWALTCEGDSLVLTDGRHQERWDVDRTWTARDVRELLHAATGNGLAAERPEAKAARVRDAATQAALDDMLVEVKAWASHPETTPFSAPFCDAPHCDCGEGEDCHANGAANPEAEGFINPRAASSREVRSAVMALQKELGVDQDGIVGPRSMRAINEIRADSRPFDVRPGAMQVLASGMKVETGRLHPDLAARLDGLKAAVDALAERLERGPATGTKADPVRIVVTREGKGDLGMTTWTTNVSLRHVGPGSYVRHGDGRLAHVCSMITDTDGTSRLFVDVVDGEG